MARFVNAGEGTPKPDSCFQCVLGRKSNGFVSDHVGRDPKIAFMNPMPTRTDCLQGKPMSSFKGSFYYTVLRKYGLTWDNVILSSVIRCNAWQPGRPYPVGRERALAERACRAYDSVSRDTLGLPTIARGLRSWDPNRFVITYSFGEARSLEAYQALMEADIAKAMRFVASGHRPLVVQGKETMELVAPWLIDKGGLKSWRGDWWEGCLPWEAPATPVTLNRDLIPVESLMTTKLPPRVLPQAKQINLFE